MARIPNIFGRPFLTPLTLALGYLVVSAIWIIFSDYLLALMGDDLTVGGLTRLQTLKGILYITLTAGFIYLLISMAVRQVHSSRHKLEQVETRYHQLFEKTGAVILVVDAADESIVDANPAAERFYGWSRTELLQKSLGDLKLASVQPFSPEFVSTMSEKQFLLERHQVSSGESRDVSVNVTPIAAGGRQLDFMLIYDITGRRILERQLRQAQKLEAVGQLTGGIAHDLNNVLTVVLADADLIAAEMPGIEGAARDDLDDLRSAARRGASMIRKLLSFSRNANLRMTTLDLGAMVADQVPMLRRVLPEAISIDALNRESVFIKADQLALEQILLNLATNSRDAMPKGGVFRLETGISNLESTQQHPWVRPGSYAVLRVTDTGHGMDERVQAKVFEPFFTTKPPSEGTGLGMAMIYGLVKQHEGFVFVDSTPGEGTTVTIYLPQASKLDLAAVAEVMPPVEQSKGGETILLVEDEDALRRAGQRILERLGYSVITAENGQRALEVLGERGPAIDLVISDLIMPKVGGRALYEAARANRQDIRFLFTSGYTGIGPGEGTPLPDVPFIQKPWTFEELGRKVREVLNSH